MTNLIICFESFIDKKYVERLIHDYWPKVKLDFRGDPGIPNRRDWENRIIQNDIWIGYATIFEPGGDTWLFDYARSFENAPCLYFRIDDTESYRPTDEDIDHLLSWPRKLVQSEERKNIRYLSIDYVYDFYRSFDEFSNALLSMRLYTKEEKSGGYSTKWNQETPMLKSYYEQKEDFKKTAAEFLKSKIANDYFFIEKVDGGLFLTNNQVAIQLGLREDNKHPEELSLIETFMYFEQFDWAK
jgi:hypothetical protein